MKPAGFTVIEVSLALMLIAFIALWSWPLIDPIKSQEKNTLESFRFLIEKARAYSLEQQVSVMVCPTQDYQSCHLDWSYPLMAQDLIHHHVIATLIHPANSHLQYSHFGRHPWFEFSPIPGSLASNGHWQYCFQEHCYRITVNRAAHVQIQTKLRQEKFLT